MTTGGSTPGIQRDSIDMRCFYHNPMASARHWNSFVQNDVRNGGRVMGVAVYVALLWKIQRRECFCENTGRLHFRLSSPSAPLGSTPPPCRAMIRLASVTRVAFSRTMYNSVFHGDPPTVGAVDRGGLEGAAHRLALGGPPPREDLPRPVAAERRA